MGLSRLCVQARLLGALLVFVLGLLSTSDSARAANAVIAEPRVDGTIEPADANKLRAAPEEALREQHYDLIAAADVASVIAGEPNLKGCHSELCFERLGRLLDSQLVLRYRVRLATPPGRKNADWHMNVEIVDVEIGALGASVTQDCNDCSGQQAVNRLLEMCRRAILESAAKPRGSLQVQSQPAGAAVFLDGTELGVTPYKRAAFAGAHKLVLRHVGYRSEQLDVSIDEGKRRRLEVTLTAGGDPVQVVVVEKDRTPVYKKPWFWVAIAGAVVVAGGVTAGIVLGTRGSDRTPPNTLMFTF